MVSCAKGRLSKKPALLFFLVAVLCVLPTNGDPHLIINALGTRFTPPKSSTRGKAECAAPSMIVNNARDVEQELGGMKVRLKRAPQRPGCLPKATGKEKAESLETTELLQRRGRMRRRVRRRTVRGIAIQSGQAAAVESLQLRLADIEQKLVVSQMKQEQERKGRTLVSRPSETACSLWGSSVPALFVALVWYVADLLLPTYTFATLPHLLRCHICKAAQYFVESVY